MRTPINFKFEIDELCLLITLFYNICPITLTVYAYLISYLDVDTCCWLLLHKTVLRLILFWLPQDLKRECSKDGNIHITKSYDAKKIVQTLLFFENAQKFSLLFLFRNNERN